MKISLVCDNSESWAVKYLKALNDKLLYQGHEVILVFKHQDIQQGELAFFVGCEKIIKKRHLLLNKHNLVVHESNLPKGKGWSPLTWQVLEGKNIIPITLFEAVEKVDDGDIYLKDTINLNGSELLTDIKHKQGLKTQELILKFIEKYPNIKREKQSGIETFYPKRTPKDSEIDIDKPLRQQFNLLRVVDNERYPAYFIKDGVKYLLKVYKY